jgi:hypothetical protein
MSQETIVKSPEDRRECPACGESILKNARKCKHCGEWIADHKAESIIESSVCFRVSNHSAGWTLKNEQGVALGKISNAVKLFLRLRPGVHHFKTTYGLNTLKISVVIPHLPECDVVLNWNWGSWQIAVVGAPREAHSSPEMSFGPSQATDLATQKSRFTLEPIATSTRKCYSCEVRDLHDTSESQRKGFYVFAAVFGPFLILVAATTIDSSKPKNLDESIVLWGFCILCAVMWIIFYNKIDSSELEAKQQLSKYYEDINKRGEAYSCNCGKNFGV